MIKYSRWSEKTTKRDTSPQNSEKRTLPVYAWQIGGTYGKAGGKSCNSFKVRNICATEEAAGTELTVAALSAKTDAVLDIFITFLIM